MAFFLGLLSPLPSHARYKEEPVGTSKQPPSIPTPSGAPMDFAKISNGHLSSEGGERGKKLRAGTRGRQEGLGQRGLGSLQPGCPDAELRR